MTRIGTGNDPVQPCTHQGRRVAGLTVVTTDSGDITTAPGATGNVQTFRITNTGNGEEAFRLTANTGIGGDDFDPTLTQIVLDTNGNGVYDPGVDTVYVAVRTIRCFNLTKASLPLS